MRRPPNVWFLALLSFSLTGTVLYLRGYAANPPPTKLTSVVTESGYRSYSKHVTKSLSELGKMPELSEYILFFNRVPKCGSEMLVLLMQRLQGLNNFIHFRLKGSNKRKLNEEEQVPF